MTARERSRSLTQRTLWRVAIRISVVVAIATIVSYWNGAAARRGRAGKGSWR